MKLAVFVFLIPALAFAGSGEGGHSTLELFWKGFNILLFLGAVYYLGRKPVGEAFENFWRSLYRDLEDSEKELKLAKSELRKAQEELEKAKVRADESVALTRESARKEIEEAKKHALEVAERVRERAKESVEIELRRAKEELTRFGMLKAQEIARELLKEAFSDKKLQKSYIESQLRAVEEKGK